MHRSSVFCFLTLSFLSASCNKFKEELREEMTRESLRSYSKLFLDSFGSRLPSDDFIRAVRSASFSPNLANGTQVQRPVVLMALANIWSLNHTARVFVGNLASLGLAKHLVVVYIGGGEGLEACRRLESGLRCVPALQLEERHSSSVVLESAYGSGSMSGHASFLSTGLHKILAILDSLSLGVSTLFPDTDQASFITKASAETTARPCHVTKRAIAHASPSSQEQITTASISRRSLLLGTASATALILSPLSQSPALAASTKVDWPNVRADILSVISDGKGGISEKGPTVVRLAWHSSGTYDKMTRTGGSGQGTIRFREELTHGANGGLDKPVEWLEAVKAKHPEVSYADIFTLAGVVAIEAMGGPDIKWRAGRVDSLDPADVTPNGRLPEADSGSPPKTAEQLRAVFGRMGFGDREIVALSGAHALGRCHAENSGYVGPWTPTPEVFNNLYFTLLLKANWVPDERQKNFQFREASGSLMMLPSDLVLIQDDKFKVFVEEYAKGKKGKAKFFEDFSVAFQKLEELGTKNLYEIA